MITVSDDKVRKPAVELVSLGDLSQLHQLGEVVNLCSDSEVVIGELMSPGLEALAAVGDVSGDLAVLALERRKRLTEFGGLASALHLDLACQRLELVDVARADLLLNRQQLQIELILIRLREERHQEGARFQDLRPEARI